MCCGERGLAVDGVGVGDVGGVRVHAPDGGMP